MVSKVQMTDLSYQTMKERMKRLRDMGMFGMNKL